LGFLYNRRGDITYHSIGCKYKGLNFLQDIELYNPCCHLFGSCYTKNLQGGSLSPTILYF